MIKTLEVAHKNQPNIALCVSISWIKYLYQYLSYNCTIHMVHTIEPLLQIVTNIPCLEYCYHFLGATEVKNQWKLEPSKPPTIARRSLAKSAFEVRSSTTAAEPAQPGREQHAFQAQQVPGKRLGNFLLVESTDCNLRDLRLGHGFSRTS